MEEKGFAWPFILVGLGVTAILAGGAFAYLGFWKDRGFEITQRTQTPSPKPTLTPSEGESFSSGLYQNNQLGFAFEPPTDWEQREVRQRPPLYMGYFENPQPEKDAEGRLFRATLWILTEPAGEKTLTQFVEEKKNTIVSNLGFKKTLDEIKGNFAGFEAVQVDFVSEEYIKEDIHERRIFLLRNGKGYTLAVKATTSTWDSYLSTFEKSLGSFKFI